MKMKNTLQLLLIVLLAASAFVMWNAVPVQSAESVTAYRTDGNIVLDGTASEKFWENATLLNFEDYDGSTRVTLRFMHNTSHIFMHASWNDTTMSNTRKGWQLPFNGDNYTNVGGNEDRITLAWSIGTATIQCGHNPNNGSGMLFDVWHWKASRTGPAGWADDKFWNGTGRWADDATAGGYMDNSVVEQAASPTEITNKLGNTTTVAAFSDADLPYWFENGTEIQWASGSISGNLPNFIPGYLTTMPEGSRGDVMAAGFHTGVSWQVEEVRELDTGNADDVTFAVGSDYTFYLAIHEDSGGPSHLKEASNAMTVSLSGDYSPGPSEVTTTTTTSVPTTEQNTTTTTTTEAGMTFLMASISILLGLMVTTWSIKRRR